LMVNLEMTILNLIGAACRPGTGRRLCGASVRRSVPRKDGIRKIEGAMSASCALDRWNSVREAIEYVGEL
jgi:hypothetical protein